MRFYHGSNTGGIQVLEPRLADHGRPYVYLTANEAVAAIYLCNAVEKPYYWFPYGFCAGTDIPVYHELYPNALREVSEGVSGYLYEVEVEEDILEEAQQEEENDAPVSAKGINRKEDTIKSCHIPKLLAFPNIPCARLCTEPLPAAACRKVDDAWELFQEYIRGGKLILSSYEKKTKEQLAWWEGSILDFLRQRDMGKTPDCSYACFVRKKFPQVWEKYWKEYSDF